MLQIVVPPCMQCQEEDGVPNPFTLSLARIPEEGVIESICNRGHRTFVIIQQMKFEILSDMAIRAIVDGYYRDAIASFISALERLYEFFIAATCRKRGITSDIFDAAWKSIANQSERQLGAFIAAYLLETSAMPKLLSRRQTELRNAVIHKGKFPERHETIRFGQEVLECALPILDLLKSAPYSSIVRALKLEQIDVRAKEARDKGLRTSNYSIPTFLSLAAGKQVDVEAAVAHYTASPNIAQAVQEAQIIGSIMDVIRNAASQTTK